MKNQNIIKGELTLAAGTFMGSSHKMHLTNPQAHFKMLLTPNPEKNITSMAWEVVGGGSTVLVHPEHYAIKRDVTEDTFQAFVPQINYNPFSKAYEQVVD